MKAARSRMREDDEDSLSHSNARWEMDRRMQRAACRDLEKNVHESKNFFSPLVKCFPSEKSKSVKGSIYKHVLYCTRYLLYSLQRPLISIFYLPTGQQCRRLLEQKKSRKWTQPAAIKTYYRRLKLLLLKSYNSEWLVCDLFDLFCEQLKGLNHSET